MELESLKISVNPKDISFINKLFDGAEGLATITTTDGKNGIMDIYFTASQKEECIKFLKNSPIEYKKLV